MLGKNELADANAILPNLDDKIAIFVKDSNAGALDSALELALVYAERCAGACDSSRAADITLSKFLLPPFVFALIFCPFSFPL